ncbi:MAG TPA: 16S rRNA (guanine(527)-N(7))-methyltransferase RsmG [Mycobacteriales bacterium]|nr:16S rRNA (guanine(527)-N(7))-methyltransferase RsmG [Mycobacteriales bacterium]
MSWSAAPEVADPAPGAAIPDTESRPAAAALLFGARLPLAERFVDALVGPGVVRGLIGPREGARIWTRHVLNCAVVAELVPAGAAVVDLGSGAGLPGIVLALVRPDLRVTLVEPMARRTEFLTEVVAQLGVSEVKVHRGRAEEHASCAAASYDVVIARAVTDLTTLHAWSSPLLRRGGCLLAMKGGRADEEIAAAAAVFRRDRVMATKHVLGADLLAEPTTVVAVDGYR